MLKNLIVFFTAILINTNAFSADFPSEEELDGIMKPCGLGLSKKVTAAATASVKSWRKALIAGESSYDELGGILSQVENGEIAPEIYNVYTACIINLVKEFNKEISEKNCKKPVYKIGRGPSCGVETYRLQASANCGVIEYNTGSGAQCGVDQYIYCETGACGWNSCPFVKKCDAKECRHPNCGVERYKTCKHSDFGVRTYKTCRHSSHGVETYKACRNPEFGYDYCD